MNKYVIEFIGTTFFIYVILNIVSGTSLMSSNAPVAIGTALIAAIAFGGNISGGHYNPAVSLVMYLNKTLNFNDLGPYITAQLLGAVFAKYLYDYINKK